MTPVVPFINIIIIMIIILFYSKNVLLERVLPFYFPPFKWIAPLYVMPDSFDLSDVCVIFIRNISVNNFYIYSDH